MDLDYTPSELMATAGARELRDREVVAVGLGLPVVASFLAKQTHAPDMTILFELGVIDPEPVHCGVGLADPRVWYRATVLSAGRTISRSKRILCGSGQRQSSLRLSKG